MRARLSALPLRAAVVAVALLLLTGCGVPEEAPEPSLSEAPSREAPSHAVSTAPDFTADSVSVELEEALLAELGEQATTLAGESALAALQDSDDMIESSGVSPEDCAPAAETNGLPETGIAVGIDSRTLEDGSAESRSVRIVRFDSAAAVEKHLEDIRAEFSDCVSITVKQGDGLTAELQRSVEDLDPAQGLVVTTETSLVMDEELTEAPEDAATDGATEAATDAPSGTAATPSLDLAPTLAVYVPAGTDLYVYTGDAETDTDAAVELIERLRERLET